MTNDQLVDTKLDWKIKRQEHHYNKTKTSMDLSSIINSISWFNTS